MQASIDNVELIWHTGDLSASGYLDVFSSKLSKRYLVNHDFAEQKISELGDLFCQRMHELWKEFHLNEFENEQAIENLAELLYHEVYLSLLNNSSVDDDQKLEYLRTMAQKYLLRVKVSVSDDEYKQRKDRLIEQLRDERLNRLNNMLSRLIQFLETI